MVCVCGYVEVVEQASLTGEKQNCSSRGKRQRNAQRKGKDLQRSLHASLEAIFKPWVTE